MSTLYLLTVCSLALWTLSAGQPRDSLERRANETGHIIPRDDQMFDEEFKSARNTACGSFSLKNGEQRTLTSKNHPKKYPNNYKCSWIIETESDDATLSLECRTFNVRKSRACKKDYLKVNDYDTQNKRFCGKRTVSVTSDTGVLDVVFKTDRTGKAKGFKCYIKAIGGAASTPNPVSTTSNPVSTTGNPAATTTPAGESDCYCGQVNRATRIVGGVTTELHEYPWQAALVSKYGTKPYCGASIIADSWIVTAAHCVDGNTASSSVVVVGEHYWPNKDETTATERVNIAQTIVHPKYNKNTEDNDIALLKLSKNLVFASNNKVAPVCTPTAGNLYDNVMATITGWGTLKSGGSQPKYLNEVTVPTMTNTKCNNKYSQEDITNNMICAGLDNGGKDSCQGDSGGPMVTPDSEGNMVQIGVVSWGYGCADARYPGVYARVTQYLGWIQGHIQGSKTCPPPTYAGR